MTTHHDEVDSEPTQLPLTGISIVDMTSIVMGPACTQALGEMGADVVKVEPLEGDSMRNVGAARHRGMGANFLNGNHSKRSLAIDLKDPRGRDALLSLISRADLLIYNVRPAAMARLGLSWETAHALNPGLIYVGLVGYGQSGPYAQLPAYDDLIQGASGLAALTAARDGNLPSYVPNATADRVTGIYAVGQVLAAIIERSRSGVGQRIDVPMFETMASFVLADHQNGRTFDPPVDGPGYARQLSPNRKPYRTLDGHISVLVYTDNQWLSFLRMLGQEDDYQSDPRYADIATRLRHIDELYAEVEAILATRNTADWLEILRAHDIPAMPVNTLETIFDDSHLAQVGFFESVEHPSEGTLVQTRPAGIWSRTQPRATRHAPRLGEHSMEVLREAGIGDAVIAELKQSGVLLDGNENEPGR